MTDEKKILPQNIERSGLNKKLSIMALLFSAVVFCVIFCADVVFGWSGLKIFELCLYPFTFSVLFAVCGLVHACFLQNMLEEEEEKQLLERRKSSVTSILDVSEDVRFTAKRFLENFERYVPPVLCIVCGLVGAFLLYRFQREIKADADELLLLTTPKNPVNLAFLSVVCCVFSFFPGVFMIGQSRDAGFRYLRPTGNMLIFGGVSLFLSGASALLYVYQIQNVIDCLTNIVLIAEALLTAEFVVSFVVEFYRPRGQQELRPTYESRLLYIVTQPGGVVRNISEAMDYQFGFRISKTGLYHFVERVFVPALMAWVVLLWLFTIPVKVEPGDLGIRERFGQAVGEALQPGMHWKLPWPIEKVVMVPVDRVQSVVVGISDTEGEDGLTERERNVILWTGLHYAKEDQFLVASAKRGSGSSYSVALLETSLPIFYRARKDKVREYAFHFSDVKNSLLVIGRSEATAYFANSDFLADISDARETVCETLKARIQQKCDALDMGIEIVSVNMKDAHPPIGQPARKDELESIDTQVAEAFQQVIIAQEGAKVAVKDAQADAEGTETEKKIGVAQIAADSEVYCKRTLEYAKADRTAFESKLQGFHYQPQIFILRNYMDFFIENCGDMRFYIVSKELLSRIYEFNFEEKAKLDLLEGASFDLDERKSQDGGKGK